MTHTKHNRGNNLVGIDAARHIQEAAKQIIAHAEFNARKREVDGREFSASYLAERKEVAVMVFEEPGDVFRIETLSPLVNNVVVKAWDTNERFLVPELRHKIAGILYQQGVFNTDAEARSAAAKLQIRNMGTVRLKDNGGSKL